VGSPCSPHVSGACSRTGGARACAPRPWRMLECGGAAVPFSRTSAAAAGGTAQLCGRQTSPKIARLAHYNFAPCGVGGGWRARALNSRSVQLTVCFCPAANCNFTLIVGWTAGSR